MQRPPLDVDEQIEAERRTEWLDQGNTDPIETPEFHGDPTEITETPR